MNNNAKPNSPDDALFDNSADDLADDLNNDIDVPVYRRDAQPPANGAPAGATKVEKPGAVTQSEAKPAPQAEPVQDDSVSDATVSNSTVAKGTVGERAAAKSPAEAEPEAPTEAEPEAPMESEPAKRDIYAMLGRARPQRIDSRPPETAPAETTESDVDLTSIDSPQSTTANTAGDAAAAGAASDRWGKVDDASPAERPATATNDQASRPQVKEDAAPGGTEPRGEEVVREDTSQGDSAGAAEMRTAEMRTADGERSAAPAAGAGVAGAGALAGAGTGYGTETTVGTEATGGTETTAGTEASVAGTDRGADAAAGAKRGTTSFGLFLLRTVLGAYLLVRGLQTMFAFGGDPGVDVFQSQLEQYNFTDILAIGIPVAEIVAGGLLILGLVTPLGAALAAVVSGFMALHNLDGFQGSLWPYGMNPYVQVWAALTVVSISIIFVGPGRISLDRSRGWATRPLASAWIFLIVAAAGIAGLWIGVGGGNPFN
ncbi:DoxX family membrane protein [Corynebacterium sp. YSMAA1_1_F7]|uniref:DoxX family membrane protein n=1 Tax=Corynebacterium sp. YSMAA1_1_F7 TaxID=3383590 RepID=UPI0038D1CE99